MLTGIILAPYLAPLVVVLYWWRYVNTPDPLDPGLRKACHGAGVIALVLVAARNVNQAGGLGRFLGPDYAWLLPYVLIAWVIALGIGASFLRTGLKLTLRVFDPPAAAAAGIGKALFGVLVAVVVWRTPAGWFSPGITAVIELLRGWPYVAWTAQGVVVWCVVTGIAKFLISKRNRIPKAPPVVVNPRGDARDMTRSEARTAMGSTGGMKSRFEDMEF